MERFKQKDVKKFDQRSDYKQCMVLTNYDPNELANIVEEEYKIKKQIKDNFFETMVKDQIKITSKNLKNHEDEIAPYFDNLG